MGSFMGDIKSLDSWPWKASHDLVFEITTPTRPTVSLFKVPASKAGPQLFTFPRKQLRTYVVIMAGLPARGKTFLAHKLCRLLGWKGLQARVYTVPTCWRDLNDGVEAFERLLLQPNSKERRQYVEQLQKIAGEASTFLQEEGGAVAFVNDDFVTEELRNIAEGAFSRIGADNFMIIEVNRDPVKSEVFERLKAHHPEEYNLEHISDPAERQNDYAKRVAFLAEQFQPVRPPKSYIRVGEGGQVALYNVSGDLPSRMVRYLLNLRQCKVAHPIYFARCGEHEFAKERRLGGDAQLSPQGVEDTSYLSHFVGSLHAAHPKLELWTSAMQRASQTVEQLARSHTVPVRHFKAMDDLHVGICDGMTDDEVSAKYPSIPQFRAEHLYTFRYPEGESYEDIVLRVESVILELESADHPVLIVAHQAILRALLSYFAGWPAHECVKLDVPRLTAWRCEFDVRALPHVSECPLTE